MTVKTTPFMSSEFTTIFTRLRGILTKRAPSLLVTEDTPTRYCLEARVGPGAVRAWGGKLKRETIPVAWVQIGKNYVSYHLMAVYGDPKARAGMSQALRARMQGKACFNFKVVDETLFKELEELTVRTGQAFRKAGFVE